MHETIPSYSCLSVAAAEVCDQTWAVSASVSWCFPGGFPEKAHQAVLEMSPFMGFDKEGRQESNRSLYPPFLAKLDRKDPFELSIMESKSECLPNGSWGQDICLMIWRPDADSWVNETQGPELVMPMLLEAASRFFPIWSKGLGLPEPFQIKESLAWSPEWGDSRMLPILSASGVEETIRHLEKSILDKGLPDAPRRQFRPI